jgi:hypothetical protein
MRILRNDNLHTPDYIKKADAFFEYAKLDPDMVSLALDAPYNLVCVKGVYC